MRKERNKIGNDSLKRRYRRILSIRKKIEGSLDRPRVLLLKSNKHLTAQAVDDSASQVMFTVATYGKLAPEGATNSVAGAEQIGKTVGQMLKSKSISAAVLDRKGYKYTGKVAAFAKGLRESGIQI